MTENGHLPSGKELRERKRGGQRISLPSGFSPIVRALGFAAILRSDRVPDFLTPLVVKLAQGETLTFPEMSKEEALEFLDFLDFFCAQCLVSPRVVNDPQGEDEISVEDIEDIDKRALVQLWGTPTAWLTQFRFRQIQDVVDLLPVQRLPAEAEPTPEPQTGTEAG